MTYYDPNAGLVPPGLTPIGEVSLNGNGLTKREYFAALAMQGLAPVEGPKTAAKFAVELADALIAALNEVKP